MDYEADSTAVIVVDMQKDFCHPDGALYAPESENTISRVNTLLDAADDVADVVFTQDSHEPGHPEFDQWGEHCVVDSWGEEIHGDIDIVTGDTVFKKDTYDAFHDTNLAEYLDNRGIETVIICGTLANVCVQETASSAALEGFDVFVVGDAVGYIEEEQKERALAHVDFLFGDVVETSEVRQA